VLRLIIFVRKIKKRPTALFNSSFSYFIIFFRIINSNKISFHFNFVGDGIYDIGYILKHNHVWIEFYPSSFGHIELSDWNKVDSILKNYIDNYGETNGLENYKISFRLDLYFNDDYNLGIY
jgi:hypothetical protein